MGNGGRARVMMNDMTDEVITWIAMRIADHVRHPHSPILRVNIRGNIPGNIAAYIAAYIAHISGAWASARSGQPGTGRPVAVAVLPPTRPRVAPARGTGIDHMA